MPRSERYRRMAALRLFSPASTACARSRVGLSTTPWWKRTLRWGGKARRNREQLRVDARQRIAGPRGALREPAQDELAVRLDRQALGRVGERSELDGELPSGGEAPVECPVGVVARDRELRVPLVGVSGHQDLAVGRDRDCASRVASGGEGGLDETCAAEPGVRRAVSV